MAKIIPKPEPTDEDVEQILFDAMRMHGMLPPSVEEFAALDAELASFELPFGPTDLDELLKRLDDDVNADTSPTILPFQSTDDTNVRNLARAAREGGTLTPEIEQKMSADKSKYLQDENNAR